MIYERIKFAYIQVIIAFICCLFRYQLFSHFFQQPNTIHSTENATYDLIRDIPNTLSVCQLVTLFAWQQQKTEEHLTTPQPGHYCCILKLYWYAKWHV